MNGKMIDLGWCTAKYNDAKHQGPKLTIVSPSSAEEMCYSPAESITIWQDFALISLRDFLIEVLAGKEKA